MTAGKQQPSREHDRRAALSNISVRTRQAGPAGAGNNVSAALEAPPTAHRRPAMLDAAAAVLLRCAETGRFLLVVSR